MLNFLLNLLMSLEQRDTRDLISKGHNPSPQKKQGSTETQVLKSDRLGVDFWLFYYMCGVGQVISFLIWKMEVTMPTLYGCYED